MCEICSVLAHSAECGNEIRVQSGVWQKWKDFHNHFEYYLFRVRLFHYAICIQRRDTLATLTIDLVVKRAKSKDSKWYIRVRESEWEPGNRNISTSKHKWHAAAALKAVHTFSPKFGDWTAIANNCNTWVKGVVGFMSDDDRRGQCDCEPITDDFDHLRSFAESIGVELTYLSSTEAKQRLPQPEDDEPGEGEDPSNQETNDPKENAPGEMTGAGRARDSREMKVISEQGEEPEVTSANTTEVQGEGQGKKEREEERGDNEIDDLNNKE